MALKLDLVEEFWKKFQSEHPEYRHSPRPEHYHYCDNQADADDCAKLVIAGIKQATSSSLWWYKKFNKPLPQLGDLAIVTNWQGVPQAITKVSTVNLVPFDEITEAYAYKEGEGDKSLDYWKSVHWNYYKREMAPYGEQPSTQMIIVCEAFETIYRLSN